MNRLVIDPTLIRQRVAPHSLGLNVNFLADHAEMRGLGQGYLAALKQLSPRSLRYPGGEKSNEYFWSQPPWTESRPTLSYTGAESRLFKESGLVSETGAFQVKPMDFDEFIGLCRAANAEPILCVGLGSAYIKSSSICKGSSREQVIESAIRWVYYANNVRGYGVKYWELGNESYWRGSIATLTVAQYTRDVLELSRAMKAIDPTIHIGVNGHVDKNYVSTAETGGAPIWWESLLKHAAPQIDFVVVHPYPCFEWGSYDYYINHVPVFTDAIEQVDAALQTWTPEHATRIRIMATETNAFDWAATGWYQGNLGGWEWGNDLGHALVLFDLLGQHLVHPRVDGVHVWNTRWFNSPSRLEDVLDDQNALLPTGQALGLWGHHLKSHLLALQGQAGPVYATYEPTTQALTVLLMNKHIEPHSIELDLSHYPARSVVSTVFSGQYPEDEHPTLSTPVPAAVSPGLLLTLPPLSITVLDFEGKP
jgi:alpha-L-arabinofuranosidase